MNHLMGPPTIEAARTIPTDTSLAQFCGVAAAGRQGTRGPGAATQLATPHISHDLIQRAPHQSLTVMES